MATEFCQKCKQSHPGRTCDYGDKGECAETIEASKDAEGSDLESQERPDQRESTPPLGKGGVV